MAQADENSDPHNAALPEENRLIVTLKSVTIPEYFKTIKVAELNAKSRHELSLHLNVCNGVELSDWRAVAEEIGCRSIVIDNMERKTDPMQAVIAEAVQRNTTLHDFLSIIHNIGRIDVLMECQDFINSDVEKYYNRVLLQDSEVTSTWTKLTVGDLERKTPEYFDAFVSCDPQDWQFIQVLMDKLEHEYGFKLCIMERDLISGIDQNSAVSELIEKRCRRVILVLSKHYSTYSKNMLTWQLSYAQALAASGHSNKLVPLLIESDYVPPSILKPYHIPDYTNAPFRDWFWDRVVKTLSSNLSGDSSYDGPSGRLGRVRPVIPQPEPERPQLYNPNNGNRISGGCPEPLTSSGDSGMGSNTNISKSGSGLFSRFRKKSTK